MNLRILIFSANGIYQDMLTLQELLHSLDDDVAVICETSPTYYPSRLNALPDVIDIFLHHTSLNVSGVVSLGELNSDHNCSR